MDAAIQKTSPPALVALARKLSPDVAEGAALDAAWEKALLALADDEFERLTRDEKRAFWNDVVKRELKRAGVPAGALAMSGLGSTDATAAVVVAQLQKQNPQLGEAIEKAIGRLRTVAIDCLACETLALPRFKSEDDRCRVCGERLPVAAAGGSDDASHHVAALLEDEAAAFNVLEAPPLPAAEPIAWEVVTPAPDLRKLLVLSKENLDWDEVLAERTRAEDERRRREEDARLAAQRAEEDRKRKEEDARLAAQRAEEDRKRKAEEARLAAERAAAEKRRLEEEARRKVEEDRRRKEEELAAAARRKADEEAARQAAEREMLAKFEAEAAEAKRKAEEEAAAAKAKAEEDERRRKLELERLAVGCLAGANAGKIFRIDDLDPKLKPSGKRPLVVMTGGKAKILVPSGTKTFVNDKQVAGIHDLVAGDIVRGIHEDDDLSVIDAGGDLEGVNADPVHFKRADEEHGGPWNYWNEQIRIGSAQGSEIYVGDRGVDEQHATVTTRFGRVVVEDTCKEEDGLWIDGTRVRAFVAKPGLTFKLGSKGPPLSVVEGQIEIKQPDALMKSPAMKPARYVRTVLHVQAATGEKEKVFLFARREVRFGRKFSKGDRVENDLVIAPADDLQQIADKQGSFSLTRDGVTVRLDDKQIGMTINDEDLNPGQTVPLKRRFSIEVGAGVILDGEVYRAPSSIARKEGPGQLGLEGGHPYECVRMKREDSSHHTYVFLVRQLRLGSGENDSLKLPGKLVGPGHALLQLSRGVLQIVAPREKHKVKVDGQTLKTGEAVPLKLGSKVLLGDCLIRFEVVAEPDFEIKTAEEAAAS